MNSYDHHKLPEYEPLSLVNNEFDIIQLYAVNESLKIDEKTRLQSSGVVELDKSTIETMEQFEEIYNQNSSSSLKTKSIYLEITEKTGNLRQVLEIPNI